jgi:general secretion pathway protein K
MHRLHGAESDYYTSLRNPYKAKNACFDTLEELFLIKGVTTDILYGNDRQKGLINFITVHSRTSKININGAPREILMAIPGMTVEIAERIISGRQNKALGSIEEATMNPGAGFSAISSYIGLGESNTFTIDAVGYKDNEKKGYAIRAIIITEGNKYRYVYYKSPAYIR